ncbi:MAG: hypothetical protein MHM6MM_008958, partial [Cercozoa sp. M6MM]
MQSIVSLVFSTRAWSYIEATAGWLQMPESLSLPETVFQEFVSRKDLTEFATLRVFWRSVEGSRLQNESLVWMPLPKRDRARWSSFQQRMSDTHSPDLWHAHRDSSVYAWVQNDTAVLTCPFEYYRRNWLRHMHAMSALPYDETHDSSELSFLTELSTDTRCVATYLSRALIERCIVQKEKVTADWCLRVVRRLVRGRATSRTARKLNLVLKKCKIKLHRKQIQELATEIDALVSKSMAARHYQAALSAKERPWRYANLDHALRCGVPVSAVDLMLSVAKTQSELIQTVSFLRETSLERFMQPLAPCMPLAEWEWPDCECTIEPARLLCFLAWQHLHNNSVDLSAFLDTPLPENPQMSNSFIRSLRFSNWHTGRRLPVAGIYDGPHYAVLWSVLASFVHRPPAIVYRNLDKHFWHHAHVKFCVTAYTKLCETAFGEDRDDVSSLFPFGAFVRLQIHQLGISKPVLTPSPQAALTLSEDHTPEVLRCFGRLLAKLPTCELYAPGMPLCTVLRFLYDEDAQSVQVDLEQLEQQSHYFQMRLRT